MGVIDIFVRRPVIAVVLNLALVLIGLRSAEELPIQQFPRIESSSIIITTLYVGASADGIRGFVTTPIERAVSSISGVDYVESTSVAGLSTVTVHLKLKSLQHGSAGRGWQPPRPDPKRIAERSRTSRGRGPTHGSSLRHVLCERDL